MSAHAHTGGMTRRRLLHAGALAGVAARGGGAARAAPTQRPPWPEWMAFLHKHKQTE
ncbi:cellulase, partial [Xanthomonas euvesicatoria]